MCVPTSGWEGKQGARMEWGRESTLCQERRMQDGNGKGWRKEHWHIVWMDVEEQEREEDWKRKVYLQHVPDR